MHKLIFLRQASYCSMYGDLVAYGLGWVMGPKVHLAVGCVGLGQLFGGLGWAGSMKIDPRTTLVQAPLHNSKGNPFGGGR